MKELRHSSLIILWMFFLTYYKAEFAFFSFFFFYLGFFHEYSWFTGQQKKGEEIPEKFVDNSLPHNLSRHPTLNAILKYKDPPSIRIIERFSQHFSSFYFSPVDKNTVLKEIRKLKSNKAVQETYFCKYFAKYIYLQYNEEKGSSNLANFF